MKGWTAKIVSVEIQKDGTANVVYVLIDPDGQPLPGEEETNQNSLDNLKNHLRDRIAVTKKSADLSSELQGISGTVIDLSE